MMLTGEVCCSWPLVSHIDQGLAGWLAGWLIVGLNSGSWNPLACYSYGKYWLLF